MLQGYGDAVLRAEALEEQLVKSRKHAAAMQSKLDAAFAKYHNDVVVSVRLGVAEPVVALACSEMLLGGEPMSWPATLCPAATRNGYAARHSKARRRQEASSQQRLKGERMQQRTQRLDLLVL
jgi:hypothetical protein